ncbi:MAG: PAS domain-containing protein [Acidimicrobiia bacterium]
MTSQFAGSPVAVRLAVLDAVLELCDDAVFGVDRDGRVASWNRSAERIFGYRADEIVGRPCAALFPRHLQGEAEAVLTAASAGDRVSHFETELQRRDGSPAPISLSTCPVQGADSPMAAVAMARDITERQVAQATLAEVEGRVREREAQAGVGGWWWDVRTGTVQWSDQLHQIHGVDPLDFGGTLEAHLRCVHAEDRAPLRSMLDASVASGQPFEIEYRVLRSDGEVRRCRCRAMPIVGSAGTVVGLRGTAREVSS